MAKMGVRRQQSIAVIAPILSEAIADDWTEGELKRALRDAYPFCERAYYPYTVWLDCQRKALQTFRIATRSPESEPLETLPLFAAIGGDR